MKNNITKGLITGSVVTLGLAPAALGQLPLNPLPQNLGPCISWDHFNEPTGGQIATLTLTPTTYTGIFGGISGIDRTLAVSASGSGNYTAQINTIAFPDFFNIDSSVQADGVTTLTYSSAVGPYFNFDASGSLGIVLYDLSNDLGPILLTVNVTSGGGLSSSVTASIPPGTYNADYLIPWTSFIGPVVTNDINKLEFVFNTPLSGDMDLDAILFCVPEPGEYALMGALGLLAFGAYRRFRKA